MNETLSREVQSLLNEWAADYQRELAYCDSDDFGLLSARDLRELADA